MGEVHLEDALRIQRERVARRVGKARRMLAQACAGGQPRTRQLTRRQLDTHGEVLVEWLRVIVERWCDPSIGAVPQPLSLDIMDAKAALQSATAEEVSNA